MTAVNNPLLTAMLPVAVEVAIGEIEHLPASRRREVAAQCVDVIAAQGDVLQYGGKGSGGAFTALARGLAALAHEPGGVTFAGMHWCTGSGHRATRHSAPCPAELEREAAHAPGQRLDKKEPGGAAGESLMRDHSGPTGKIEVTFDSLYPWPEEEWS